ncbi:hypothetical protein [Streptomyces purpurascens]
MAAALAVVLFTGASFQQLATARPDDYDEAAATLALHDRTLYTDGCAAHPVPGWASVFLRAAACFALLAPGQDQQLLAASGDRPQLLRLAEAYAPLAAARRQSEGAGRRHRVGLARTAGGRPLRRDAGMARKATAAAMNC